MPALPSTSSSAIHQSLGALLPTHAQKLPPQVIHLSESLLAQSRQRAAHLKPEEEIARAYACCEIACKRLRAQCRLPAPKTNGAPCKPAAYKKLTAFLERVLSEDEAAAVQGNGVATTPARSLKRRINGSLKSADDGTNTSTSTDTATATPNKTPFLGKLKASARKGTLVEEQSEAPGFVMPSIRRLCGTFGTPLLAPHVYTGTCVVLKLAGLWPRHRTVSSTGEDDENDAATAATGDAEAFEQDVTGLLIALYLMTLTRMQTAKMTSSVYKRTCTRAVAESNHDAGTKGVEAWIRRINRQGYCGQQDWWLSVPESVFDFDPDAVRAADAAWENERGNGLARGDDDDGDEETLISTRKRPKAGGPNVSRELDVVDDPEGVLLPGLATMMQDALDLLSQDRGREFAAWKKTFLRRLDMLDKGAGGGDGNGNGMVKGNRNGKGKAAAVR